MNVWTKAQLYAFTDNFNKAFEFGKKALEICKASQPYCAYVKTYKNQIEEWSLKIGNE